MKDRFGMRRPVRVMDDAEVAGRRGRHSIHREREMEMPEKPLTAQESVTLLSAEAALERWRSFATDPGLRMSELQQAAAEQAGLSAFNASESSAAGSEFRTVLQQPVTDRDTGSSVGEYTTGLLFLDVGGADGERVGLIGSSVATSAAAGAAADPPRRAVRVLMQQGGGWDTAMEFTLEEGSNTLVPADGLWDAFKACIGRCSGPCLAALPGCLAVSAALPAAVACLAIACGACAARCAACAVCDCSWLCSFAVGCCHQ
ncbi:hypothetical protein ACFYQ5_12270 [Streptomyces sp. NPDC005794]|uniref:hypothetical protein n=1 Tax=Streptomyces sp. NPDC005794 TaxID=3364733 RepID=UPI0036A16BB0